MNSHPTVYLDCDGVLADFDKLACEILQVDCTRTYEDRHGSAAFWGALAAYGGFYEQLPLMPDALALFRGVEHLNPVILTGCPMGGWAEAQKVAWGRKHFPGTRMITCRSADKRDYCKPGDILIDDWPKYRHLWEGAGGRFILHTSAAESLATLRGIYPHTFECEPA